MPGPVTVQEVLIPAGATGLSSEVDINGYQIVGIYVPSGWTAADISFKARQPGKNATTATLLDVYDSSDAEVVVQAAASRYVALTAALMDALLGLAFIKVRSGTTGTPVNQTGAPTIGLVLIPLT
jgi:hypothetical protein